LVDFDQTGFVVDNTDALLSFDHRGALDIFDKTRNYVFLRNSFSKEACFFACGRPIVCRKTLLPRTNAYFQTRNS
jgi:hypothetical protein